MRKIVATILSLAIIGFSHAKDMKIGVVDFQKVIVEAPAAKKMNSELQKKYKPRNSEIRTLKLSVEKQEAELQKNESIMTADQVDKTRNKLISLRRSLERKVEDFQRALQEDQIQASKKFSKKVESHVEKIGEEGNFDIILQKQATVFVKGQNKKGKNKKGGLDITAQLIKVLK